MSSPQSPLPLEGPLETSESQPKTPDVPESTENPADLNPEVESANEADVSSDTCSNLYLGKLVSDTEDEGCDVMINGDVHHDVKTVTEDEEAGDSNDYVTDVVTSSSRQTNYALIRQDPLTKEKFIPIDEKAGVAFQSNDGMPQTAFVPLSSHPSSSATTPKPAKIPGLLSVSFDSKVS